jgi:hypothetical protein
VLENSSQVHERECLFFEEEEEEEEEETSGMLTLSIFVLRRFRPTSLWFIITF